MTMTTILNKLEVIREDIDCIVEGNDIEVTVLDSYGCDDYGREMERELVDEDMVDDIIQWLEERCDDADGDIYRYYSFGNITVRVGYASYDL